ncbi:carotenoid oxygenase [Staphylotrichum tortipilum]|uniref:Carotenoid oxygenase n=1 Tax=Staphylotrichum tortipilum TaxID=2831512 RepID=A0AAN6MPW4_9PEZI|nr:carotenoid oxygenase [Staphylotrichum longicolle]
MLPPFQPDPKGPNGFFGLPSTWSHILNPFENGVLGRFEGEIPKQLDGTFYRIMVDPFYPLAPVNPVIEGDGNICALRICNGRVSLKTRYVNTERQRLERQASARLFGLYRNPFSHHPCVRAAVDSTESALPYAVDPDTLETLSYDPFASPSKTFSAHPKVDPFTNELVVFGYEAKGLGTPDIVVYVLDAVRAVREEQWLRAPWPAFIHDCAITPSFIVLVLWPYDASVEKMKAGGQHWTYNTSRPATFLVTPRRRGPNSPPPKGWAPEETHRTYHWDHTLLLHTAGSWEDPTTGAICFESSRMFYNVFPELGDPTETPFGDMHADYVRWTIDPSQPGGTVGEGLRMGYGEVKVSGRGALDEE